MHSWFLGFDLDVGHPGIRRALAAKDAEFHQIVLFSLSFDMHTPVSVVVFHEALDVVLHGIAVNITSETDIEHPTVDANGIGFHGRKVTVFS